MNKFLTKIATAFVGMTMAIGVGITVGLNQEVREARAADLEATFNTSSTTATNVTASNVTSYINSLDSNIFTVTYNKNGAGTDFYVKKDDFRLYGTKSTYKGNYITVSVPTGYQITTITFVKGDQTLTLGTAQVFKGAVSVSSNRVTGTEVSISSNSCTINSTQFTIYDNNKNVSSNTQVRFGSITIKYTISGQINAPTYAASGIETTVNSQTTGSSPTSITGVSYTYTPGSGVTLVSPTPSQGKGTNTTGVFKATGAGTLTVSASKDGYSFSAQKEITIEATTLAASLPKNSYEPGQTVNASDLSVSYSTTHISSTALTSGYSVSPTLPYTFTDSDLTAGSKEFTVSMSGTTSAVIEVSITAPTPAIEITNDTAGVFTGKIGDSVVVTFDKFNDTGLSVVWDYEETDDIADFDSSTRILTFKGVGESATLKVSLVDGNEVEKASDTVAVTTLVPTISIKDGDNVVTEMSIFVTDEGTLTTTTTNAPTNSTIEWSMNVAGKLTFDNGAYTAVEAGEVVVSAKIMYDSVAVATASVAVTISELSNPELTIKYDNSEGDLNFLFGQELDSSKLSASYKNNKGVSTDVSANVTWSFNDLNFIGTKTLSASYNPGSGNITSKNSIKVSVTNVGTNFDYEEELLTQQTGMTNTKMSHSGDYANSPWWAVGQGSDYAAGNSPYLLKLDDTGDYIVYYKKNTVLTNEKNITLNIQVKMIGGANTSHLTVYALQNGWDTDGTKKYSDNDISISSSTSGLVDNTGHKIVISGSQNNVIDATVTLSNSERHDIYGIMFYYTKGSNIGVSCASISLPARTDTDAVSAQAVATKNYLAGFKTCEYTTKEARENIEHLVEEYNAMHTDAKKAFASLTLTDYDWENEEEYYDHAYVGGEPSKAGVNALDKLKTMVDYYNKTKGELDDPLVLETPAGDFTNLSANVAKSLMNTEMSSSTLLLLIVSFLGISAITGYILIKRRKEN